MYRRPFLASILVLCTLLLAQALVAPPPARAAGTPLRVAVVVSTKTDAWFAANTETSKLRRAPGQAYVYSVLSRPDVVAREGWQVTQVGDNVFDSVASLEQYDVIVLTQVFCLDVQPSKNLQTYVGRGGGLVCMWGSPRVAPQFDTGPAATWPEHWANILRSESGEWGPMSEVYQMLFVNDQFWDAAGKYFPGGWFTTPVWPGARHPILDGAKSLLQQQGYPSGDFTLNDPQDPLYGRKQGFELTQLLSGNTNTTPLLSFKFTNSEALKSYPRSGVVGGYPAAVAARYKSGRSAYFYFYLNDFIYYDYMGGRTKNSSGVTNRDAATALLESSVRWAGTKDGVNASIRPSGVTWGDVKSYGDAIYAFQYIANQGNVSAFGQAEFRVYDPAGKLVQRTRHGGTYVSTYPGKVWRYACTYKPSGGLKTGKYRVEMDYVFNYPWFNKTHKEIVYVVRSQGTGIKTIPYATAASKPGTPTVAPNPMTPNGDGWADTAGVGFQIDQPARVSVRVMTLSGKVVATCLDDVPMGPGPHFAVVKTALANGMYNVAVDTRNTAGTARKTSMLFVSRFGTAPALGTNPTLTDLTAVQARTDAGAAIPGRVNISFNTSDTCYAVLKIFTYSGEVKSLAVNTKVAAGTKTFTWDGTDAAGKALPAGGYRYYLFVHSGGTKPVTRLGVGVAPLKR